MDGPTEVNSLLLSDDWVVSEAALILQRFSSLPWTPADRKLVRAVLVSVLFLNRARLSHVPVFPSFGGVGTPIALREGQRLSDPTDRVVLARIHCSFFLNGEHHFHFVRV